MRKHGIFYLLVFYLGVMVPSSVFAAPFLGGPVVYQPLPRPGEKVSLGGEQYFTYGFVKQPKLGSAIMKVEIFTRGGKRDTTFVVKGRADMPSMRGAHSSGDTEFSLSAKGVYLLPVQLVMPGDWEIRFTFMQAGKPVYRGSYRFDL